MDANEEKKTDEKREQKPHSAFGWRQNVHWIERLQFRTAMMSVRFSKLENHEKILGTISIHFRNCSSTVRERVCVHWMCTEIIRWNFVHREELCVETFSNRIIADFCFLNESNSRFCIITLYTLRPEHSSWKNSLKTHAQYTTLKHLQWIYVTHTSYTYFLCECVYF